MKTFSKLLLVLGLCSVGLITEVEARPDPTVPVNTGVRIQRADLGVGYAWFECEVIWQYIGWNHGSELAIACTDHSQEVKYRGDWTSNPYGSGDRVEFDQVVVIGSNGLIETRWTQCKLHRQELQAFSWGDQQEFEITCESGDYPQVRFSGAKQ